MVTWLTRFSHGPTVGQLDCRTVGWSDGTVGRSDGRTVGPSDGRTVRRSDGRMVGRPEGRTVGRSDCRTEGRMDGWTVARSDGRTSRLQILLPSGRSCSFVTYVYITRFATHSHDSRITSIYMHLNIVYASGFSDQKLVYTSRFSDQKIVYTSRFSDQNIVYNSQVFEPYNCIHVSVFRTN